MALSPGPMALIAALAPLQPRAQRSCPDSLGARSGADRPRSCPAGNWISGGAFPKWMLTAARVSQRRIQQPLPGVTRAGTGCVSPGDICHRVKAQRLHDPFPALWSFPEGLHSSRTSFSLPAGRVDVYPVSGCPPAEFAPSAGRQRHRNPGSGEAQSLSGGIPPSGILPSTWHCSGLELLQLGTG